MADDRQPGEGTQQNTTGQADDRQILDDLTNLARAPDEGKEADRPIEQGGAPAAGNDSTDLSNLHAGSRQFEVRNAEAQAGATIQTNIDIEESRSRGASVTLPPIGLNATDGNPLNAGPTDVGDPTAGGGATGPGGVNLRTGQAGGLGGGTRGGARGDVGGDQQAGGSLAGQQRVQGRGGAGGAGGGGDAASGDAAASGAGAGGGGTGGAAAGGGGAAAGDAGAGAAGTGGAGAGGTAAGAGLGGAAAGVPGGGAAGALGDT